MAGRGGAVQPSMNPSTTNRGGGWEGGGLSPPTPRPNPPPGPPALPPTHPSRAPPPFAGPSARHGTTTWTLHPGTLRGKKPADSGKAPWVDAAFLGVRWFDTAFFPSLEYAGSTRLSFFGVRWFDTAFFLSVFGLRRV